MCFCSWPTCKHGKWGYLQTWQNTDVYRNNQFTTERILSSNSSSITENCCCWTWMAIFESDLSYFPMNRIISTLSRIYRLLSPLTVASFCISPGNSGPRYIPQSVLSPAAGGTWTDKGTRYHTRIYIYVTFLHYILKLSLSNQTLDHVNTLKRKADLFFANHF